MPDHDPAQRSSDAYPLNRDFLASARLNLQHHVWTTSLHYLLHPSIPIKANTLIADMGCGTGIAALELARQGSHVEAFDLSLEQCPPRAWRPANVSFHALDIFGPVPEQLIGRYDVVFIRHFICVVQSGDPMPLLRALLTLLKPGGCLQWQEWDLTTNAIVRADPTSSTPKMEAFMKLGGASAKKTASWVRNLHLRFGEAGAELVVHDRHRTATEAMLMKQEVSFLTYRESCAKLRAENPSSESVARLEKLVNEAFGECLQQGRGSVVDCDMVTWVVKKRG